MDQFSEAAAIWLASTVAAHALLVLFGMIKMRSGRGDVSNGGQKPSHWPVDVLVPVKGSFPDSEAVFVSLLTQDHPDYRVVFIAESQDDPVTPLLESLCAQYPHAEKVISGPATACAQKNFNLVAGAKSLRPETRIIVTADSTNVAHRDWLRRLVRPIETSEKEVVTTFRTFLPDPETLGGICQAIYAAFVFLLQQFKPTPWGGATGIRRDTFEKLRVTEIWSRTVVDDLVLGNLLDRGGIPVVADAQNRLRSPLRNQTVAGFLAYLDRQILFPRFTNPGIWLGGMLYHLNATIALPVTVAIGLVLFPLGIANPVLGWVALGSLLGTAMVAVLLKRANPYPISLSSWLISFGPCLFLAAFIYLRSIFRSHLVWHGRKYWTGLGGEVRRVEFLP
jgi:hypothetical protein